MFAVAGASIMDLETSEETSCTSSHGEVRCNDIICICDRLLENLPFSHL